eukprot:TRINITY_DN5791_c0_g1_i1.p1 TRINITY_DN5791_c0_g1~~TRINITY_DN5791_c0_g1_i1.p1  ORF type:complete len:167 (+),score=30.92 TRINITY_DN5791_c0_g1_i1:38-538(+)
MAVGNIHKGVAVGYIVLAVLGQAIFGSGAKETVLMVIGCFIHFIASGLLIFSLLMLFQTIFDGIYNRNSNMGNRPMDIDMIIAYSLFSFTGLALTCVAVFLRSGSWVWNFIVLFLGIAGSAIADPQARLAITKGSSYQRLVGEEPDTWSTTQASPQSPNTGIRARF